MAGRRAVTKPLGALLRGATLPSTATCSSSSRAAAATATATANAAASASRTAFFPHVCSSTSTTSSSTTLLAGARRGAYTGNAGEALGEGVTGGAKKLSEIAKVPLLMKESAVRVREIWLEQFREKPLVVPGTLTAEEYRTLKASATACPMFLVPVPRGEGYMNLVWQYQNDSFLYQTLESFQQGGSGAIDLGVVFFTELQGSHQLVLLHGELKTGLLTKEEAAKMVRFTREAYMDPSRFAWIQKFNHRAREFDYNEYLKEFKPIEKWHAMGSA